MGIPYAYERYAAVCTRAADACSEDGLLTPDAAQELRGLGLSVGFHAAYNGVAIPTIVTLVFVAVAAVIFQRRSTDPVALFGSFMLLLFGGAGVSGTMHYLADAHTAFRFPANLLDYAGQLCFAAFFYVFPDGRFVPPWTRWLVAAAGLLFGFNIFLPDSAPDLFRGPFFIVFIGSLVFAQIYRYKRVSSPAQRQQTKWVVFGSAVALVGFSFTFALGTLVPATISRPLGWTILRTLIYGFILLIPLSIGVAILRYRLWDIDVIINRTLVYGALTGVVVGLYVLVVGGLGTLLQAPGNPVHSLAATGLVAVVFAPLRDKLQRGANKLMWGERDDPYAVLSRLGQRLEGTLEPEAVLPSITEGIARALRLPQVAIWLLDGEALRLAASHGRAMEARTVQGAGAVASLRERTDGLHPSSLGPDSEFRTALSLSGTGLVLPLTHRGQLIGALSLAPRSPGEDFSPADRRLLRDLAAQAGAAVHAVQLTVALGTSLEELRRSRERLVAAQEEERRRIQRDLHDGLGPALASMRLRLDACLSLAQETTPALVGNLERLYELVGQATGDIRRLVYDLRPPVLDQLGLVAALRQHCERFSRETGIEVRLHAEVGSSVPAAAEVAIFRVVQEALVNVQKHASASRADVRLERRGEWIELHVHDDGTGLPTDRPALSSGTGIRSMRERAEVLGGTLSINSHPGAGTELVARIPDRR